jgi:hypothetical protein
MKYILIIVLLTGFITFIDAKPKIEGGYYFLDSNLRIANLNLDSTGEYIVILINPNCCRMCFKQLYSKCLAVADSMIGIKLYLILDYHVKDTNSVAVMKGMISANQYFANLNVRFNNSQKIGIRVAIDEPRTRTPVLISKFGTNHCFYSYDELFDGTLLKPLNIFK